MILNSIFFTLFQFLIKVSFINGIEISNDFNLYNNKNNDSSRISFLQKSINKYSVNTNIFKKEKYIKNTLNFNSFNFNIQCENQEVCNIYTKELDTVTKYFTSTFEFYNPIYIDLYVTNLTDACFTCMALSAAPKFVPLRENVDNNSPIYIFPQSLARQLILNKDVEMAEADFSIILNSVIPEDIDANMVSRYILTHEIMHGLGFIGTSALANFHLPFDWVLSKEDILVPTETFTTSIIENNQLKYNYTGFYPFSIFEKYIVNRNNPDHYLLENVSDIYKIPLEPVEYISRGNNLNDEYINIFRKFYMNIVQGPHYEEVKKIATVYKKEKSLGFKTSNGNIVPLQTFDHYFSSTSSIFHTEPTKIDTLNFFDVDPYNQTAITSCMDKDFLMNYSLFILSDIDTIVTLVGKDNRHGAIGPGIVDIMKTIGWTEKGQLRNERIYYIPDDFKLTVDTNIDYLFRTTSYNTTSNAFLTSFINIKQSLIIFLINCILLYFI